MPTIKTEVLSKHTKCYIGHNDKDWIDEVTHLLFFDGAEDATDNDSDKEEDPTPCPTEVTFFPEESH